MFDVQHPDFVNMLVTTGAGMCLQPPVKTEQMFCYRDPKDRKFYLLSGFDELDDLIVAELTPEYSRSGSDYKLVFEQADWLHMEKSKIQLLANLSSMQGIHIESFIIEYEPNDEYLLKYMHKGLQDSLD